MDLSNWYACYFAALLYAFAQWSILAALGLIRCDP
jgi:hypothetical protein